MVGGGGTVSHTANGRATHFSKGNVQMTEIKTYDQLIEHLDQEDEIWFTWKDTPEAMIEILRIPELITSPSNRIEYALLKIDGKSQLLNLRNGRLKSDFVKNVLKGATIVKIEGKVVSFTKETE